MSPVSLHSKYTLLDEAEQATHYIAITACKTHRWAFASSDSMTTAYTITATTQYL